MRRFYFFASIIILLLFASLAWADASLYRGANSIGAVRTIDAGANYLVSVEDVGRLFGFTSSRKGEELFLTRGGTQLRVIANSAAAWRGFTLVPLTSSPVDRDGKLWVDTLSAIAIFQPSAGSGPNNRLRFSRTNGNLAATMANAQRREMDLGIFDEPAPAPRPAPAPVNIPAPAPVRAQAPAPAPIVISEPAPIFVPPAPVTPTPAPVVIAAAPRNNNTPSKADKYESFRPEDSKKPRRENYNGTAKSIRWSSQESTHKKIRAVIDIEEGSSPQVYLLNGSIHALFESSPENFSSPFTNVQVKFLRAKNGIDLIFSAPGFVKIDKLILDNPSRLVFDFFFPEQMQIIRTSVAQTPTPARPAPEPVKIPIPTVPDRPKPAPVVIPTPTVPDRPAITIPTTPTPSHAPRRNLTGKKTVVIDPGHGGKDPGASDNGVIEKNVNLAVGLELERVLTTRGFNVVMTRRTDVYLKLQERTDIANNVNADLFISVHVNALPSKKSMSGFEIYIMALPTDKDAMNLAKVENREYVEGKGVDTANVDRRTEMLLRILGDMQQNNKISESTDFASALHRAGVRNKLPMRRVAQAPFFVLRGAGMPAVLLELGFVTNAIESQLLTRKDYQQKIAQAMTEGIINYLK